MGEFMPSNEDCDRDEREKQARDYEMRLRGSSSFGLWRAKEGALIQFRQSDTGCGSAPAAAGN